VFFFRVSEPHFDRFSQPFGEPQLNKINPAAQVAAYKDNTLGHALHATEQEFFLQGSF